MSFNSLGTILTLTTFGESHGLQIGGILDGIPAGITIDSLYIQQQLDRRKPGQSKLTTDRKESDLVQLLSGIYNQKTTGHPIGFSIQNQNQNQKEYSETLQTFRPSHADFTYEKKYGIRDPFGSGRASARETANWVVGGAIAKHIIPDIEIYSYVSQVGDIALTKKYTELDLKRIDSNDVRCPDMETAEKMHSLILKAKEEGDSLGGVITCVVKNVPIGLGEPIFKKLEASLAKAMLSINASKGFEIGSGFEGTTLRGSEHNDLFNPDGTTQTNHSGGIQGGISNGMDIYFRVAFKPTATISKSQKTITSEHNVTTLEVKGRHDPCVVPRAVPIVDALTSLVLADMMLLHRVRTI